MPVMRASSLDVGGHSTCFWLDQTGQNGADLTDSLRISATTADNPAGRSE
jgi:hypothetical protein